MKIYTKTGDKGVTSLLTGERVKKSSRIVEAYGTVDEINSALGLARAAAVTEEVKETILKIQKMLPLMMAELASSEGNADSQYIKAEHIADLEKWIDHFDAKLKPLKEFIVPGDNIGSAALDLARTVTRRAEREVLRLQELQDSENYEIREGEDSNNVLIALNRLSDLCFVLARFESENCS